MSKIERVFRGTGVSTGVAIGHVLKLDSRDRLVLKIAIAPERVAEEAARFERALVTSREQLQGLKTRLAEMVGPEHGHILEAHLLMLEDGRLRDEVAAIIRESCVNAEWAVRKATDRLRRAYRSLEDPYFRERGSDVENIVERILLNLEEDRAEWWASLPDDLIIVSRDFDPSSFILIGPEKVRGLALEGGGRTSHTAIIARSLRVPAVMEIRGGILPLVNPGDLVVLDGESGEVVANPAEARLASARARGSASAADAAVPVPPSPLVMADGAAITLRANLDLPHEVRAARQLGAEGIGLFRSEFLFLAHPNGVPALEEQVETYRMLAEEIAPYPVAIRTLDVVPGRVLGPAHGAGQESSVMGLRGIRLGLRSPHGVKLFRTQLAAIARSAEHGAMEIVLPMVSSVDEITEARRLLSGLRASGGVDVPLGIMVETPGAVLNLGPLAREADFLAVGTNDLIQFALAVDREIPAVADLYQALHPAILHLLGHVARVAAALCKTVRICGEVSANPLFAVLLIGMGFDELSLNAYSIPRLRPILSALTRGVARQIAARARELDSAQEVAEYLVETVSQNLGVDLASCAAEIGGPVDRIAARAAPSAAE